MLSSLIGLGSLTLWSQNYKIEASAREQNYKIEMGNIKLQVRPLSPPLRLVVLEMQQLFQGISAFSAGAAKTATAYIDAKNEAQFQTDYNEFMMNPEYRNESVGSTRCFYLRRLRC